MSDDNSGPVTVVHFGLLQNNGMYEVVQVRGLHRKVEVMISPTGRSVQVYVDGVKWGALIEEGDDE